MITTVFNQLQEGMAFMTSNQNVFRVIPDIIKENVLILRSLTQDTRFFNVSLTEAINLLDAGKFEILLSLLEICKVDLSIIYEILTIIINMIFYIDVVDDSSNSVLIKYCGLIIDLFSMCSVDEFRLMVLYYIKNLIISSNGMLLYSSLDNNNNNFLTKTGLISRLTNAFNSAKPYLKDCIIETLLEISKFSKLKIFSKNNLNSNNGLNIFDNSNNQTNFALPLEQIIEITEFIGNVLSIEVDNADKSSQNTYLGGGENEFSETLKTFIEFLSEHISCQNVTNSLYNSGLIVTTANKLIQLLPNISNEIINYKRITKNNIAHLFTLLSFACCSNEEILNRLLNSKDFLSIFTKGVEVFSHQSFFNQKIIETITTSMFSIMTQEIYFPLIISNGILFQIKEFICNNIKNISYQVS